MHRLLQGSAPLAPEAPAISEMPLAWTRRSHDSSQLVILQQLGLPILFLFYFLCLHGISPLQYLCCGPANLQHPP